MTTILSLNIDGGTDRARLLAYLDRQRADVVVLTEWRDDSNGQAIKAWAETKGFHGKGLVDCGTKSLNGVFVASKFPFTARSETPPRVDPTTAGVMMLATSAEWAILACYFPQKKQIWKQPFFQAATRIACDRADEPFIMIGDLNNGNQQRDRSPLGAMFIGAEDFGNLLKDAILDELWVRNRYNAGCEYSYATVGWKTGNENGFRIDHALANAVYVRRMQPVCHYDHSTRIKDAAGHRLSPHSALIVT